MMHEKSLQLSNDNPLRLQASRDESESGLTDELKQMKHKEFIDRKRRQQLRNDCEELRVLAEQLRLAAITKDRNDNITAQRQSRELAKNAQVEDFKRAEADRQAQPAKEMELEALEKEKQKILRENILSQINETHHQRVQHYSEAAAERQQRIEIQRRIEVEDRAEEALRSICKKEKLQSMLELIEQRKADKVMEKKISDEEIVRLYAMKAEADKLQQDMLAAKKKAIRSQEEISLRIGKRVQEMEDMKRQRHDVLLDLLQAEYKAKDDERFRKQLEQETLMRQQAIEESKRIRAAMAEQVLEDARLRHQQMMESKPDKSSELEVKEFENQRRKRKEYGSQLLAMIEENNRKRAEVTAENIQFFDEKSRTDAELQERIKKERLQMLASVPSSVLQYLPKQALSKSDREYFNVRSKSDDN